MHCVNKERRQFLRSSLGLLLTLVLVFSSFSLVLAAEGGVSEGYGEDYYAGGLLDDDGYVSDDDEVVDGYDEYGNNEIVDDCDEYAQDSLAPEMQEVEEFEATTFGAGFMPAWGLAVQEGTRISAGDAHSFVLMPDNSLWGWGRNWNGKLGDGTTDCRLSPVWIMNNVATVSAGDSHTMVITNDGDLWAWGTNCHGQLGNGTATEWWTPHPNPIKIMDNVATVSAGTFHTMAITTDGNLWGWGRNWYGQLGDGTQEDRHSPVWIMDNVVAVSAGSRHTLAITADGSLWGWGNNWHGQLGNTLSAVSFNPVWIKDNVATISAGYGYTMAITTDGSLWAWGRNCVGQLGDGTQEERHNPVWIMDNVITMSARHGAVFGGHTMAIRADGSLWSWGHNTFGQLGNGTISAFGISNPNPIKVMDNVAEVSIGSEHTLAITTDGCIWTWGGNGFGQLGDGTGIDQHSPVLIKCHTDESPGSNGVTHRVMFHIVEGHHCCTQKERTVINSPTWAFDYWLSNYWHYQQQVWNKGLDWTVSRDGYIAFDIRHGSSIGQDYVGILKDLLSRFNTSIVGWRDVTPGARDWFFGETAWPPHDLDVNNISPSWNLAMVTAHEPLYFATKWHSPIQLDFDLNGGYSRQFSESGVWIFNGVARIFVPWRHNVALGNQLGSLTDPHRDDYAFVGWYWQECRGTCPGSILSSEDVLQIYLYCGLFFSLWPCPLCGYVDSSDKELTFTAIWEPTTQGNTPDPNKNLTHHYATMTASSSFHPVNTAPHFTNDNITTANPWRPANPGSGYLTARFDEAKNFNQIRIYQNGNRIQNYQLKYSNDGVTWNVLHSGATTPAAISTYPFGNTITAQYVRLVIGQSLNANPAAVLQFDIRYMP